MADPLIKQVSGEPVEIAFEMISVDELVAGLEAKIAALRSQLSACREALEIGRAYVAEELRKVLECVCLFDEVTREPIRETIDPAAIDAVEVIEAALAQIDAALRAKGDR